MLKNLFFFVSLSVLNAFAALNNVEVTGIQIQENLSSGALVVSLEIDGSATVPHPADSKETCTLTSNSKSTVELAGIARAKGYLVDIVYRTQQTGICKIRHLTLDDKISDFGG